MRRERIFSFLGEIGTYTFIEDSIMVKAKSSKITTDNNKDFKDLVLSWIDGAYDEDPESLAWEVARLL
jgi:hypothetical protein